MIAGIDEAGRGPVLGPLVVAGVAAPDEAIVAAIGARDSKQLSPGKREAVARVLRTDPDVRVEVRVIEPAQIDAEMRTRTLNDIEMERFQDLAHTLDAPTTVVDAADVDAARFGRQVAQALPAGRQVVSEHKADANHPIVGAASIIAKVERDRAVAELARRLERKLPMPLGSGYPSDPATAAFLAEWHRRFGDLPEGTRRSWETARRLVAPSRRLDEFR